MDEPEKFLREELRKRFTLKEKSISPPEQYLGNKVSLVTLKNGVKCQRFSLSQYVQAAVKNVENYQTINNLGPLLKTKSLQPSNYCLEANATPELTPIQVSYFQSLIRVLQQIAELG